MAGTTTNISDISKEQDTGGNMIGVLIGVLIIVVVGAICFWAIDKFATDRRLANLLKLLVVLICLGAILQRVLPLTGTY
jgi:NhaP-type Na+/H+ or K+/H+ antiporter